jgi:hypothetical protein
VRAVPRELRGTLDTAQIYHELLEHRWFMSEQAQRDVGLDIAVDDYVRNVLPHALQLPPVPDQAGDADPGE